jgi:hypothetical protein
MLGTTVTPPDAANDDDDEGDDNGVTAGDDDVGRRYWETLAGKCSVRTNLPME